MEPARRFRRLILIWVIGVTLVTGMAMTVYVAVATVNRDAHLYGHWVANYLQQTLDPRVFTAPDEVDSGLLHNIFRRLNRYADVGAVKLKAPSGLVVWSDAAAVIGEREPVTAEFRSALAGNVGGHYESGEEAGSVVSRRLGSGAWPWLYELYIPIRGAGDNVVGVVEMYQRPQRILNEVEGQLGVVWGILLLAAVTLFVPTLRLFQRTSKDMLAMQADLNQTRRQAEVGEFVSMIVHDTRNLLASIRYACQRLASTAMSPEQIRSAIQDLDQPVRLSFGMMNDLLAFVSGKRPPLDVRTHKLAELIEGMNDLLTGMLEPGGHRLIVDVDPELSVDCDAEKLTHILVNLTRNSGEAMSTPGQLEISARQEPDAVRIFVRDSGPGITPELLDKMFEPFVSHAQKSRPGLGLAIIRDLMERHGGAVSARNLPSAGAEVELTFPAAS